jgi:small subunit ribosomal protein S6
MRRYETVFIVNPELTPEQHQPLFEKLKGLVPEDQGMLVGFDEWGHKRLAYEVKKHTRGYYVLMDFCGDGALVKELERNLRFDDRVLKYMTVVKDEAVDLEQVKAEMEAAAEQESRRELAEKAAEGDQEETLESAGTGEAPAIEPEQTDNPPETGDQEERENETT